MRAVRNVRFDLVELVLITTLAGVVGWTLASVLRPYRVTYGDVLTEQEYSRLEELYGPEKHSEHEEEWIIRDYFGDRRNGTFVDIGANHYKNASNTYYMEANLGWSGIAVDPQEAFAAEYARFRPRTRFYPLFVSDKSDAKVKLYVSRNSLVASGSKEFTESLSFGFRANGIDVPTITLTDLLDSASVTRIDLLSIDVELAEPAVLAGFDIERFRPELVCIEGHPQVRQQIIDYFDAHNYGLVGRYLRVDADNLYFKMPHH